jgi:hypothetical protein
MMRKIIGVWRHTIGTMRYQQTDAKSWLINVLFESEPNLSNQMIPYRERITIKDKSTDKTIAIYMDKE